MAPSRFVAPFLLVALVASACGSSVPALEIGEITIDRAALAEWIEDAAGPGAVGVTFDTAVAVSHLDQLVRYEALVDLLAEHGTSATVDDLDSARDRLLAAGLDSEAPGLETLTGWQAALDLTVAAGDGVRSAYEANSDLLGHELCASHILVSLEEDASVVHRLVESGRDFAGLAGALSQDPGSAGIGGALGCVPIGMFVPTFERAVLGALRAGVTLVGPVPSQFGFHVIRIDEVRRVDPVPFDALGDRVLGAMLHLATLTRPIDLDSRYGTWDPIVGRVVVPVGPVEPGAARPGS
jgi:peptidyl-prolyl cis-trans isomerase C